MSMLDLLRACTRVRVAAETYMDERDLAGLGWSEESVTDVAIHKGLPKLKLVQFNRQQEGRGVGADYLWWWIDQITGECFGMLVQAKRLQHEGEHWTVDIRHGDGRQLGDLYRTAEQFDVPAMIAVYTGGRVFRRELVCFHNRESNCLGCRRMAISLISMYQLWIGWESPVDTAGKVLNDSIPLENLVDPALDAGKVWDRNLNKISSADLRSFLTEPQDGPREIAKRIFKAVSNERTWALSATLADPIAVAGQPIFRDVPRDRGHYPGPYFEHFLRGLRASPPQYVQDLLDGELDDTELDKRVAGVVLASI